MTVINFDEAKQAKLQQLVDEVNAILAERGVTFESYKASFDYCAVRYLHGRLFNSDITIEAMQGILEIQRAALKHGI